MRTASRLLAEAIATTPTEVTNGETLRSGLALLYRQAVEQAYVNNDLSRSEALTILGSGSVAELDYAKQALLADIRRGLDA